MADPLIEPGASNLTPESFLEVLRERRLAKREHGEAGAAMARIGKKMKNLGINKPAFEIFERLSDMETDEAQAVLKAVIRYGTWVEKPFAVQTTLFPGMAVEKPKDAAKLEFTEFEVEDQGYRAGFAGQLIDSNPHSPSDADNASFALWRQGWHKGQEARVHKSFGGEEPGQTASKGKRGRPARATTPPPSTDTKH